MAKAGGRELMIEMLECSVFVVGKLRTGTNISGEGNGRARSQNLYATRSTEIV